MCDTNLLMSIGDVVKVACGSLTVEVIDGEVSIPLTEDFVATLTEGAFAKVNSKDEKQVEQLHAFFKAMQPAEENVEG